MIDGHRLFVCQPKTALRLKTVISLEGTLTKPPARSGDIDPRFSFPYFI